MADRGERELSAEEAWLAIEAVSARMYQLSLFMERAASADQEAYYRARVRHCQRLLDRLQSREDREVFRVRLTGAAMRNQQQVRRVDQAIGDEPLPARSNWDGGAWVNTYLSREDAERAMEVWERAGLAAEPLPPDPEMDDDTP